MPVAFASNVTAAQRDDFYRACGQWSAVAAVQCVPHAEQDRYLLVAKDGNGCSSYLGAPMFAGIARINLEDGCWHDPYIVPHEIGHAFGLPHEHQRNDRDDHIRVLPENIMPEYLLAFLVMGTNYPQGPYDPQSLMHYHQFAGAFWGRPSFEATDGYAGQFGSAFVSPLDGADLRTIYGGAATPAPMRLELVSESGVNPVTLRWSGGAGSYVIVAGPQPGLSDYGVYAMGSAMSVTATAPVGVPIYVTVRSGSQESNMALIQVR